MKPTLDLRRWPIAIVEWPASVTLDEIDEHFAEIRALLRRGARFGIVLDLNAGGLTSKAERDRAASHLQQLYVEGPSAASVHVAHVVPDMMRRSALSALYWLSPPPFPVMIFRQRDDAIGWLERWLAEPET